MDPLRAFIDTLQTDLTGKLPNDVLQSIDAMANDVFAKFELVPKHEYAAHLDLLKSLEAQISSLESRLKALEEPA